VKISTGAALALALLASGTGHAAVLISSNTPGDTFNPLSQVIINFNSDPTGLQATSVPGQYSFSGSGTVVSSSLSGAYAAPVGDTTPYLATTGTENLVFSSAYTQFGLYWGSIDSYNTLNFFKGGSLVGSFSGAGVASAPSGPNGSQTSGDTNRYVTFSFTGGDAFDTVQFVSTTPAFEVDDLTANGQSLVAGVPEPSTWAMIFLGFLGVGFMAYRREVGSRFRLV
jgi:hypothetical protein